MQHQLGADPGPMSAGSDLLGTPLRGAVRVYRTNSDQE